MMLQDRMVRSEHSNYKKREFDEILARPAARQSLGQPRQAPRQSIAPPRQSIAPPRQSGNFNRSPSKRVRVSGRFKRMSPSPSKLISPCRRGIGKLRIQAKSPLTAESPGAIVALDQSPLSSGAKRSPAPILATPNKKSCVMADEDDEEDKENIKGEENKEVRLHS